MSVNEAKPKILTTTVMLDQDYGYRWLWYRATSSRPKKQWKQWQPAILSNPQDDKKRKTPATNTISLYYYYWFLCFGLESNTCTDFDINFVLSCW